LRDITSRKRIELENQVIYEITHGITTTSNLDELMRLIHNALSKVVYAENIFVALYDPQTEFFSFPYFVDKYDPIPPPTAMLKSCTAYVYRTLRPFLFSQEAFDRLVEQNEVEQIGSFSPSWIGVPLQTPAMAIGVLVLQHYEMNNVYNESDVRFLTSIGNQIAMAIDRKQSETALVKSERDLLEAQKIA
jgi:transcriptional regulator with GAF, ATPase, and Fis domain